MGQLFFPILVQNVQHQSATVFGIVIAPCALITGLLSPVAGKLYDRIGMKPLAIFFVKSNKK